MNRLILLKLKYLGLVLGFISRMTGKGRGTALSGWLVEHYAPWALSALQKDYKKIVYITGTNGITQAALTL
jgi:hypothetical protein